MILTALLVLNFMYESPVFFDDELDQADECPWHSLFAGPTYDDDILAPEDEPGDTTEFDKWKREAEANPPRLVFPKETR